MAKRKPCAIPLCPTLRATGSYVCAAHKPGYDARHRLTAARPHKYGAIATTVDGVRFQSKKEAARYGDLQLLQKAGRISKLWRQVPYPLIVNGIKICTYVADAVYLEDGVTIVEDSKGVRTPEYRLKAKLMLACHGITIRET